MGRDSNHPCVVYIATKWCNRNKTSAIYVVRRPRSTYLDLLLVHIGRLECLSEACTETHIVEMSKTTYQVAHDDFAFSSGRDGGCDCGLCRLCGLLGRIFGNSSSGNTGFGCGTLTAGAGTTRAGNLFEALVELGRHGCYWAYGLFGCFD